MATKLGTLTLDLVARIGSFTQGMRQASTTAEREMGRVQNSVVTVDGLIKKLAVTAGAVFSVGQISNYADSYTGIVNKLKLVTKTQGELTQAMNSTYQIAQSTSSDWESVITVYTKFQKISEKLGLSQEDVARITETVTKAVAMSGANAEEAQRALNQFGQALNTGALKGQDLNSILSQTPGLTDAISEGMGVASGSLKELGAAGQLTNEMVITSLQKVASSVDRKYAETATLISSSFDLVKNSAKKMIGEFDAANGISEKFVAGMKGVADNLGTITQFMVVGAAFMAGTYIPMVVKGTYATISDTVSKVANITASRAKAVADLDVAKSNLAATAAMVRAMGVTNAQTATMMANARAAYQQAAAAKAVAFSGAGLSSVLLGPVGVGVALASVAAGYLLMKDGADESTKSLRENNETVEDAIKKYNELDEVKRRAQLVSEKDRLQDLGKEYDDITAKLITATYSFSRHNDMTSEQSQQVNALIAEYKKSGDIDEFSAKINSLSFINQTSKDRFNTLGGAVKSAGDEFKNQKSTVEQMAPALKGTADQAKQSAVEVSGLSEELKKLFDQANQNLKNSQVTTALASRGYSDDMISLAQKYLAVEGAIVKNEQGKKVLRDDVQKKFNEEWIALQKQKSAIDARNDADKERTKELEKHARLIKASTIDAVISSGEGNYNSVNLGQKGGYRASTRNLTEMTVAQVLAAQKAKDFNAAGKYQTINSTLQGAIDAGVVSSAEKFSAEVQERIFKQYLVALKRPEIKGFITGNTGASLNDALLGSAKEFASVANPSTGTGKSYYDGKGNNKASISAEKMTESLLAQQKVYRENIALGMTSEQAWLKSFNSSATVVKAEEVDRDKFLEDMINRKNEQTQKQKEIQVEYYSDWQKLEVNNQEKIKRIEENFANDTTERDRLLGLQAKAYETDVGNWFKAQDEKVAAEREANKQILAERYNLINASLAMSDQIKNLSSGAEDINARASMSPQAYAEWSLSNNRSNAQADLKNQRVGVEQDIMTSDLYSNDDDRYGALVEAHQAYRDGLAAIDVAYDQQVKDLAQQQHLDQLGLWGGLLSQGQNTFSQLTQSLKDAGGEQSGVYKTMFAMQQAMSIASAIVSTEEAATKALTMGPVLGIPMSSIIRGMGYANVGIIASQAISGMAHDGIDNIPKEGTWLLDKGERVVDSRTNGDLKDYLAKGGGSGGNVTINQSINIASDGTATTQNDSKQLGALIINTVLAVIRKEQRQGGLLSK
ncbi:tape measure protein [Acinetobacter sp. KS-LM10]|uniref:tape measure protein n=1 Tax=Acinetobacter sp. KS-LM10 TaxID=3120518 RepID=UPI0030CB7D57